MNETALDFEQLVQRLRQGDEAASQMIVQRFERQIQALIRRRTSNQVRPKFDSEDVSQSVFRSFFVRQRRGQFHLVNWENLWSILAVIAKRKCGHRHQYYRAQRRRVDLERTIGECDFGVQGAPNLAQLTTPEQSIILADMMQQLLSEFSQRDQRIIQLHIQYYTLEEIGQQVRCAPRTVRRVVCKLRERFLELAET